MIISDKFKKELSYLNNETNYILKSNIVTDYRLENFFKTIEKVRYNLLSDIKAYNKNVEFNQEKIHTIDTDFKAEIQGKSLQIYVPETLPSYKHLKTHTHKRILLNVAEITKPYSNMFDGQVFIFIKIFDNFSGWDVDNRSIKPIADGLITSGVIKDDTINKMYYCVKGEYSDTPHTEITVEDAKLLNSNTFQK